jgi:hypothetical protein
MVSGKSRMLRTSLIINVGIDRISAPEKSDGKTRLVGDVAFSEAAEVARTSHWFPAALAPASLCARRPKSIRNALPFTHSRAVSPKSPSSSRLQRYSLHLAGRQALSLDSLRQLPLPAAGRRIKSAGCVEGVLLRFRH